MKGVIYVTRTVLGVFKERKDAEDAINELDQNSYNPQDMSIAMRNGDEKMENTGSNVASGAVSGATNVKSLSSSVDDLRQEDYEDRYYEKESLHAPVGMKGGRRRMKEDLTSEREFRKKTKRGRKFKF